VLQPEQIALIINQDAGKAPAKMKLLSKLARQHKMRVKFCDGPDLDYSMREALKDKKIKRLIVGGGDGSISLAASLIRRKRPDVQLAVLPVGTANYYAKSLGIPRNIHRAFDAVLGEHTEKRHLCQANKRDFLLGVNIGATSRMFAEVTHEDKQRFGKIAYIRGVLQVLRKVEAPDIQVHVNGEIHDYVSTELVVLNQHIQEPLQLMPKVKGADPYFEIITYGLGNSKLSPLFAVIIFAITLGKNQKYLKRIKARKAIIKTKKSQPVSIDGDNLEKTPVKIELLKNPVTFVCAK
jgi:YegS/Rv2252/BmrU family lipid kinase